MLGSLCTRIEQFGPPSSKIQSRQAPHGVKSSRSAAMKTISARLDPLAAIIEARAFVSAWMSCDRKRCSTLQPTYTFPSVATTLQPTAVLPISREWRRTDHAALPSSAMTSSARELRDALNASFDVVSKLAPVIVSTG